MCASKVRMELNISTSQKYMGFLAEVHGLIGEFAIVCRRLEGDVGVVHLLPCDETPCVRLHVLTHLKLGWRSHPSARKAAPPAHARQHQTMWAGV